MSFSRMLAMCVVISQRSIFGPDCYMHDIYNSSGFLPNVIFVSFNMCSSLYQPVKTVLIWIYLTLWPLQGYDSYLVNHTCTVPVNDVPCIDIQKPFLKFSIVSEAPKETPKVKKFESFNADTYKTDEQKKEEVSYMYMSPLDRYLSLSLSHHL